MAEDAPDAGIPTEDRQPSQSPETESKEVREEEAGEPEEGQEQEPVSQDEQALGAPHNKDSEAEKDTGPPPLPDEDVPPLPNEPLPGQEDDGWDALWDENSQAYYFYNRFTGISQWENPRVPDPQALPMKTEDANNGSAQKPRSQVAGGYDPAIHGDYDPTAWYAQQHQQEDDIAQVPSGDPNMIYTATGTFNRFTGKWQPSGMVPEQFNEENRSRRQMNAYFDVDAAANDHDGKSLKAERSGKKLTKKELKAFREKRRERKEEKRKAWLRD